MKAKSWKAALVSALFIFTSAANAGVITLNNAEEVGVLSLSESFTSFYDYRNAGSHTGYEQEATAVMFLAEYNGDLALFTLLDKADASHSRREADLTIDGFDASNVLLVDDSNESTSTGFSWAWVECCSDGMVYQVDDAENFNLDLTFSNIVGFSDFKFLSFSGGTPVEIDVSTSLTIQSVPVPEPSTLAIFALGVMGLASRKFKR